MITLSELTKDYGTTVAVDKLSLTVNAGEIYGFISVPTAPAKPQPSA
jgi:ABC-type multidrug transport system ATPase subunit